MPSMASPLIKICGLSTEDTLEAALDAGADRVGFVFFARSPRHVEPERAAALGRRVRGRAAVVALTVDADDAALDLIARATSPDMVQLHGREDPARVAEVRARLGRPVIKAVGVSSSADVAAAMRYAGAADEILFDAKPPPGAALPGGNGASFDWHLLAGLDLPLPFMLSGGLDPDNVAHAVSVTGAPAVDVSSGVESAPGVKSPDRIRAFVRAARGSGAP